MGPQSALQGAPAEGIRCVKMEKEVSFLLSRHDHEIHGSEGTG